MNAMGIVIEGILFLKNWNLKIQRISGVKVTVRCTLIYICHMLPRDFSMLYINMLNISNNILIHLVWLSIYLVGRSFISLCTGFWTWSRGNTPLRGGSCWKNLVFICLNQCMFFFNKTIPSKERIILWRY